MLTPIVAGDLRDNQGFTFEEREGATIFYALAVNYLYVKEDSQLRIVEITLSHETKFIMPYGAMLWLYGGIR